MPYIRNHRRYLKIAFGKKLFLLFIQAITGSKITVFFPRLFTVQIELVNSFIPSHSELPIVCQMIFFLSSGGGCFWLFHSIQYYFLNCLLYIF